MALTRAQLIQGNNSLGTVLTGQVQGVTQGTGVTIAANGQISFDSATASGVMRLNNPAAYNAYVWPGVDGTVGQQLTTDGAGNLTWTASGTPTAGLGINIAGGLIKVSIPTASSPPVPGPGAAQAVIGSMYWDDVLNQLFIYYNNSGSPTWVQAAPSALPAPTYSGTAPIAVTGTVISANLATATDAATGTSATVLMTPQFAVPKDASGMTGAAILPSGTDTQRTAITTLVTGMQRYNTTSDYEEVYTGATNGWRKLAYYTAVPTPPNLTISANGPLPNGGYYDNIIINAGVTATASASTSLRARTSIQINGTIDVGYSFPGGQGGSISSAAALIVVPGIYGQGFGQTNTTYGYAALSGTGGRGAQVFLNNGAATGSQGGSGGGALILRSEGTITIGAAGVITADGGNATVGAATVGTTGVAIPGAGGGSGGMIYLEAATSITLNAASRLYARGGAGNNAFNGGTIPSGAGGGGGGGGGYIIVTSPLNTTTGANFVVTGGAAGTDSATPPIDTSWLGGWGGSWGGAGGDPISGVYPNIAGAGAAGQVLFNAFL
jgi:hypothetical protein